MTVFANRTARQRALDKDLHAAACENETAKLNTLLRAGADPLWVSPDTRMPALLAACLWSSVDAVRDLLAAGITVDQRDPDHNQNGVYWSSEPEIIRMLIDAGACVDTASTVTGETPLHGRTAHVTPQITALLIAADAKLDARSNDGCTPLIKAMRDADKNDPATFVQQMIDAGADTRLKDNTGRTAHAWATMKGLEESANLLKGAMVRQVMQKRASAKSAFLASAQRRMHVTRSQQKLDPFRLRKPCSGVRSA